MKIVICGAGRVGMSIAEHLSTEENDITVIDSSIDAIQKIMSYMMFRVFMV